MPKFRVMLKGAPVFLLDLDSNKTQRLGFYTTRWVEAASPEDAAAIATRLVLEELAARGTKNPPDQPVHVAVEELAVVSWFEAIRRGPGRGYTFYPDDAS